MRPVGVGRVGELDLAHRPGKPAEEKRRGLFVVPDVSARAPAAAAVVVAAFEPEEAAVFGAKAGLRAQRAEIAERSLLDFRRQAAVGERSHEAVRALPQILEPRRFAVDDIPGVAIPRRVEVADAVVGPRRLAARLPGVAVRKMPGQQQRDVAALARRDREASRPATPSARRWP